MYALHILRAVPSLAFVKYLCVLRHSTEIQMQVKDYGDCGKVKSSGKKKKNQYRILASELRNLIVLPNYHYYKILKETKLLRH